MTTYDTYLQTYAKINTNYQFKEEDFRDGSGKSLGGEDLLAITLACQDAMAQGQGSVVYPLRTKVSFEEKLAKMLPGKVETE